MKLEGLLDGKPVLMEFVDVVWKEFKGFVVVGLLVEELFHENG